MDRHKDPNTLDIEAIDRYKNAKQLAETDLPKACQKMTELSLDPSISNLIKTLSLFKAHTFCEKPETLQPIASDFVDKNSWFENLNIERIFHNAELSKNPGQRALAYKEKSKILKKNKEKVDLLLKALEFARESNDQSLIEEIQNKIYKIAPRLEENPAQVNWLRVAQDFTLSRDFEKGRKYYQKIIHNPKSTEEEKYTSLRQYRNSFKIEQRKPEYQEANQELLKWLKPTKNYLRINEAYVSLARSQWTEGDIHSAKETLTSAEKFLKNHFPLNEIYYIRGKMADEVEDYSKAIDYFKTAESESKENTLLKEKIIFSVAWDLRKLKKYEEAATHFSALQKITEDPFAQYRYAFWEAESWRQSGQVDAAVALFKKIILDDPLGYYGLLSYRKLDFAFPPLQASSKQNLLVSNELSINCPLEIEKQVYIRTLALADEPEVLSKYVSSQVSNFKNLDSSSTLFILTNLANAGLYQPLFSSLGSLDVKTRNEILSLNPELLFPKKYYDQILTHSTKFNIKPELVLSIIRQESSFDPMARSAVDALGLMQVMPTVAKVQEKIAGVQLYHHEDLFKPEINIPLGISLLSRLMQKYNGQMLLTAAAYNANEKAISNWLKTRFKNDPIEFIEDVPYEETRSYMKLILRNFVFYTRMSEPNQSLKFPEELLIGFDSQKVSTVSN